MRFLAIGATGFIGRHVVNRLAAVGYEVCVLHRGKTAIAQRAGVSEIIGDRSDLSAARAWRPDAVIDMILSSEAQARTTMSAFRGVARRVVAPSSGDVYRAMALVHRLEEGPLEPVPLTEDSALRTQTAPYPAAVLETVKSVFPWVDADYDKVRVERVLQSDAALPATIL